MTVAPAPRAATPLPPFWAYVAALGIVAAVVALRYALDPVLGGQAPLIVLLLAPMLAAYVGGLGPGLFATATAGTAGLWLFVGERDVLWPNTAADMVRTTFFAGEGVLFAWLLHSRRVALARLADERGALERSRQDLMVRERRFRQTLEASPSGMLLVDGGGRIVYTNRQIQTLFGYERDELLDQPVEMLVPDTVRDAHAQERSGYLSAPEARMMGHGRDLTGRHRDGRPIPVEIGLAPLRSDEGPLVLAAVVDIRARKEAEAQLRQSEERFRAIADNIPQLAWMADETGLIHWYNRRWYDYTGTTLEDVAGFGWRRVHHPEHVERVEHKYRAAIASGEPWEDTFPLRGADGAYRWFLSRAIPIRVGERIVHWFGSNTDVTEQRAAQEAIRRLNADLENRVAQRTRQLTEANQELQAFASTIAHDLRAPLRNMQGFARALLEDFGAVLPAEGRGYAERVAAGAERMDLLIQDLLAYASLTHAELALRRIDLRAALHAALADLERQIMARGAVVEVADGVLPAVLAHPATLGQVLVNLVDNALKFVAPDTVPHVRIDAARTGGMVRVSVHDNGIGIAPRHQQRIFQVFERLHSRDVYPGTGIGLAIVRKGVERMGGRVGLASHEGAGSTFWFEIPAARTAPSPAPGDHDDLRTAAPPAAGIAAARH